MDLLHMRQFKAIADNNSVSKASEILYVSQPALSKSLRDFEKELGCLLFDRTGNRVILNENGKYALAQVNRILAAVDEFKENMLQRVDQGKELRILSTAQIFLSYLGRKLIRTAPALAFSTVLSTQHLAEQALLSGQADVFYTYKEMPSCPGYRCVKYSEERLAVSLPPGHSLSGRKSLRLDELTHERIYVVQSDVHSDFADNITDLLYSRKKWVRRPQTINESILLGAKEYWNAVYFTSSFCEEIRQPQKHRDSQRSVLFIEDEDAVFSIYKTFTEKNSILLEMFSAAGF